MRRAILFVVTIAIFVVAQQRHFERLRTPSGGWMICAHCSAPENPPSSIQIPIRGEPMGMVRTGIGAAPGEPIEISGTVFGHDGKPAPGIILFVYHTGSDGMYNHPNDPFQPLLFGYIKTDHDGHYSFRSIRPGPYPDHTEPAHIHIHAFGPNYPERFLPEYWFDNDPQLKPSEVAAHRNEGTFSPIVHLKLGSDQVWRGTRDLRLP